MSAKFTVLQLINFEDTGDTMHRMRWPAAQLALQDSDIRIISLSVDAQERYDWALKADLLFLIQTNDTALLPVIRKRKSEGFATLVEYK